MHFIDTHFHLDLWADPKSIIEEIEKNKIYTIAVTNTPSVFFHTYNLTEKSKYIRPALGFHPELVYQRKSELPLFLENLKKTRYIGEIGLDYGKQSTENKKEQKRVFEKIIGACSIHNDKVLTIHSRGSYKDVIDIIGNDFSNKVILHWYSGSLKELERAVEYGFYFSVNLPMTISLSGQKVIKSIPPQGVLTESDGPFAKYRGSPCSSLAIPIIINSLSQIYMETPDVCKNIVYRNFKRLLNN